MLNNQSNIIAQVIKFRLLYVLYYCITVIANNRFIFYWKYIYIYILKKTSSSKNCLLKRKMKETKEKTVNLGKHDL